MLDASFAGTELFTGAVTVEGNFVGKSTVTADAEAGGSDVSVGAAIAINVVTTNTTARTLRSLTGDDGVAVRITSIALTAASAEAGAKGANKNDENANGKADKALIIPKEGFGFSRDAKVRMGPPKFSAAAFTVADDPVQQRITMRYLF